MCVITNHFTFSFPISVVHLYTYIEAQHFSREWHDILNLIWFSWRNRNYHVFLLDEFCLLYTLLYSYIMIFQVSFHHASFDSSKRVGLMCLRSENWSAVVNVDVTMNFLDLWFWIFGFRSSLPSKYIYLLFILWIYRSVDASCCYMFYTLAATEIIIWLRAISHNFADMNNIKIIIVIIFIKQETY